MTNETRNGQAGKSIGRAAHLRPMVGMLAAGFTFALLPDASGYGLATGLAIMVLCVGAWFYGTGGLMRITQAAHRGQRFQAVAVHAARLVRAAEADAGMREPAKRALQALWAECALLEGEVPVPAGEGAAVEELKVA